MRIRILFCVILASIFFLTGIITGYAAQNIEKSPPNQVIAYYFHANFRCPTCHAMEKYTKEAIEGNFKNELDSGRLVFKTVNVDKKGNTHYVDDYQLYTKSLVISKVAGGRETEHKNLTKIWEYVRNKDKFLNYVTKEIKDYLKE